MALHFFVIMGGGWSEKLYSLQLPRRLKIFFYANGNHQLSMVYRSHLTENRQKLADGSNVLIAIGECLIGSY